MNDWRAILEEHLAAADAPAVLNRALLARFARSAKGRPVAPSSLSYWLKSARVRGKLPAVQRGLFLNRWRRPAGTLADAAPWLRTDAVVSLNSVLGDAGVLNNPSHAVTAVVPLDRGAPPPRLGRQRTRAGSLHFFGLPRRILEAGATADRLSREQQHDHPRATPEKALLDWLYLAASPRSHRTWPPPADLDMDLLNLQRLRRLAKAADMQDVLQTWLQNFPE